MLCSHTTQGANPGSILCREDKILASFETACRCGGMMWAKHRVPSGCLTYGGSLYSVTLTLRGCGQHLSDQHRALKPRATTVWVQLGLLTGWEPAGNTVHRTRKRQFLQPQVSWWKRWVRPEKKEAQDFLGGPVARNVHSQFRRSGFNLNLGTRSHMPQPKSPHAAMKTEDSTWRPGATEQINKC